MQQIAKTTVTNHMLNYTHLLTLHSSSLIENQKTLSAKINSKIHMRLTLIVNACPVRIQMRTRDLLRQSQRFQLLLSGQCCQHRYDQEYDSEFPQWCRGIPAVLAYMSCNNKTMKNPHYFHFCFKTSNNIHANIVWYIVPCIPALCTF